MTVIYLVLAVILGYLLLLGISALLVDPNKDYKTHSRFYRRFLNSATAIGLWICRVKIHTTGREKLPQGRALYVCNHRSNFDPLVSCLAFKEKDLAFISKPENFRIPVFGRLIRKCCFLPIDRQNPRNAIKTVQKAAKLIAQDQVSIAVYPEGTQSKTGELLPFHNGVLKIAQKANAPIVVLSIYGTENIYKNFPLRRTYVYLDVLAILEANTLPKHTDAIGDRIRALMENSLEKAGESIG